MLHVTYRIERKALVVHITEFKGRLRWCRSEIREKGRGAAFCRVGNKAEMVHVT